MKNLLVIIALALMLNGCGDKIKIPQDQAIETLVRDSLLTDGLGDLFTIENFAKTNGFRESENVYIVDVKYDLVFQKSFIDVVREIRADPTGPQYGVFGSKFILSAIQSNFGQFDVGDRIQKVDKIRLHNTEQGWLIAN